MNEEEKSQIEIERTDYALETLDKFDDDKTLLLANMIQVAALNKTLPKYFKFDTIENVNKQ